MLPKGVFKYIPKEERGDNQNQAAKYADDLMKSEYDKFFDGDLYKDYQEILKGNCVYLPNFFCKKEDNSLFDKLCQEIKANSEIKQIPWGQHKKYENPDFSDTFNEIIQKLSDHFNTDIFQTRMNYYHDENDWKVFHKDAHAYNKHGQKEDFTIGASFGESRSLVFLHEQTKKTFAFPQHNGDVFAFSTEVNDKFLHGVPKVYKKIGPRISIIAWGKKR